MSTKFTPRARRIVLEYLRDGTFKSTAAEAAGISPNTLENWLLRGESEEKGAYRQFYVEFKQVEAAVKRDYIQCILTAAHKGDWRAASWLLARRFPSLWGAEAARNFHSHGSFNGELEELLQDENVRRSLDAAAERMEELSTGHRSQMQSRALPSGKTSRDPE